MDEIAGVADNRCGVVRLLSLLRPSATMYEVFGHTADLGLRVRGATLNELFADAGRGLLHILVNNPEAVESCEQMEFAIDGASPDFLLFDWLSELLYAFESRRLLLSRFEVAVDDAGLKAVALGEPMDPKRHQMEHEVKAITYHGLKVVQTGGEWLAEVIVDI